jgi:hypothetical protein
MKKAHCSIQIHEQCSYSNTGCDYLKCLHRSWQIKLYHWLNSSQLCKAYTAKCIMLLSMCYATFNAHMNRISVAIIAMIDSSAKVLQ